MSEKRALIVDDDLLRLSFSLHSLARGTLLLLLLDVLAAGSPSVIMMLGGDQWRLIFDIVILVAVFTLCDG